MPTSVTKEFEKASSGEGSNRVVGKETNNEKSKLSVGLWRTTRNYEVKFYHSREKNWIDMNKETRKYFTGRINEELGSIIRLTIARSLGKALGET